MLRAARRRAGLTQRELAERAGVPQSTIGRIEIGAIDPRASTLTRLLRKCGLELDVQPALGVGVDRSQIRALLALAPRERIERTVEAARGVARIRAARRR